MGIRDSKKSVRVVLSINNNILGASWVLSITNKHDSNLPYSVLRKIVDSSVSPWIKVKGDRKLLIRGHVPGYLQCLLIKGNSRMMLM
jgi:hypothetical protein